MNWIKNKPKSCLYPNHQQLMSAIKKAPPRFHQDETIYPYDIAFLQYTGGTTGIAKGAILTHSNILSNLEQLYVWIKPKIRNGCEAMITALPLYHIFALTANLLLSIRCGSESILVTNPRDIKRLIKLMSSTRFTAITGVDTLFFNLMKDPNFHQINFKSLQFSISGGMAIRSSVAEDWHRLTGCHIMQAYGLTEASPAVCACPITDNQFREEVGLPLPSTQVSIRDINDREVSLGESGELWIKGPQVMKGYWSSKGEKGVGLEDDWFKTGDIVEMNSQGFIRIVDRKKDMILVSGFNVFPREIEEVLLELPGVQDVAVVGESYDGVSEMIIACVISTDDCTTEDVILQHCRRNLVRYKIPKRVVFMESFPKSSVGKILKRDLKTMLSQS